jgi:hypothetical protein
VSNVLTYEIESRAFNQIERRQQSYVIVYLTKLPGNGCFPSVYRSGNLSVNEARDENELHTWESFEDEARRDLFVHVYARSLHRESNLLIITEFFHDVVAANKILEEFREITCGIATAFPVRVEILGLEYCIGTLIWRH